MKDKLKRIIPLCVLISAFIFTTLIFSTTYAKFITEKSLHGSVHVAKWDVTANSNATESPAFTLNNYSESNKTADYIFSVNSSSEVAVSYDVVITLQQALTENCVSFIMEDMDGKSVTATTEDGKIYTFSNIGTFTADGGTRTHALTIQANDFTNRVNRSGITVKVVARQVN